jgi:hypothetical protein
MSEHRRPKGGAVTKANIIPAIRYEDAPAAIEFRKLYPRKNPEGHVWSFGSYDPTAEG